MNSIASVAKWRGGLIGTMDPTRIESSKWTQGPDSHGFGQDFERLKQSIADANGNLQPIKVRPAEVYLPWDLTGSHLASEKYEIVFGHARHAACEQLGLPVFTMVEDLSDSELFRQFVVEYIGHPIWRPWRLATCFSRALSEGLFPTMRRMANCTALDLSEVGLLMEFSQLPQSIRNAYGELVMNRQQGKKLIRAFKQSPDTLTANASTRDFAMCRSAAAVFGVLTR